MQGIVLMNHDHIEACSSHFLSVSGSTLHVLHYSGVNGTLEAVYVASEFIAVACVIGAAASVAVICIAAWTLADAVGHCKLTLYGLVLRRLCLIVSERRC